MARSLFIFALLLLLWTSPACSPSVSYPKFWTISNQENISWFESSSGKKEFMLMVQNVQPEQLARKGPSYHSKCDPGKWPIWTSNRIKEMGFKGVGAWCDPSLDQYMPFCKDLNVLKNCHLSITSPFWPAEVDRIISQETEDVKENPNLIGYYLDNELNWNYLYPYAQRYFAVVSQCVRRHDPHHLILGVRFNEPPPRSVLEASRGCVDAHSFNIYSNTVVRLPEEFEQAHDICRVPIILSEFSFYSADNTSGDSNSRGFGGFVVSQNERAKHYLNQITAMASIHYVIGADFFQYNDEPPGGREVDGENCNFGIVDVNDRPYPEMLKAIQTASAMVNSIHARSR